MWTYNNTDELYHFGVKGMKWGVRRYQNDDGSLTPAGKKRYSNIESTYSKKTGEKLYIAERRKRFGDKNQHDFDVIRTGKKVGKMFIDKQGDNLYISWLDTKESEQGKGYANAYMDYLIKYAEKNNYKTMTLEVPGISKDARHIYEKHGFEVDNTRTFDPIEENVWGGLTAMKRRV